MRAAGVSRKAFKVGVEEGLGVKLPPENKNPVQERHARARDEQAGSRRQFAIALAFLLTRFKVM
jgi:hypothetical protein